MVLAHDTTHVLRTRDITIFQDVTFDTMLLSTETLQGLHSGGFHKPSPVQLHGIPLGKCGFDILLEAKSGTGKTAVFSVIALEKLNLGKGLQVVILAPTREIAAQICDVIKVIGSGYTGLCVEVVMGGLPVHEDIAKFSSKRKVHIVVGSPGRLRHLIHDGHIDTSSVRLLVLDEADKLVEKSFQADINYIFSALPKQKQVIMSSATYPEETKTFICQYVRNCQHVCPDSTSILLGIEQKFTLVSYSSNIVIQTKQKYKELLKILSQKQFKQCLIFCNYQARVAKLHNMLTRDQWPSEQLYGQQDQTDRLDALKILQEYKCRILVATDLAARGIDASNVDLVINFEPPYEWQTYLHRIGRAGRYGSYGIAVTILSEGAEKCKFMEILNPMKDLLKMSNLWDGSCFFSNGEKSADGHQENDNNGNISTDCHTAEAPDLWQEITSTSNGFKEMQSFEDLNNSFNQSLPTNIETFSEILQSFENNTEDEYQHICYANIEVHETSAKQTLSYLRNKINAKRNELELTDTSITKYKNQDQSTTQSIEQIKGVKSEKDFKNIEFRECIAKELNSKNKPTQSSNYVNGLKTESDNTTSVMNKEMALLGLPMAFASKRDSLNKKKVDVRVNQSNKALQEENNNFSDHDNVIETCSEKEMTVITARKQLNNKIKFQPYMEDVPASHEKYCVVNTSPKTKSALSSQTKVEKYHNRQRVYTRKSFSTDDESDSFSNADKDLSTYSRVNQFNNYTNWFKQLKMRTKQLEMAFYIEEMSKM